MMKLHFACLDEMRRFTINIFKSKWKCVTIAIIVLVFSILILVIITDSEHNKVKKEFLFKIQEQIDKNLNEESYKTDKHILNGDFIFGDVYLINNSKDTLFVKKILEHAKPINEIRNYKPTNIKIIVSGLNIGYAGSNDFYLHVGNVQKEIGYCISSSDGEKLWKLLNSLKFISDSE